MNWILQFIEYKKFSVYQFEKKIGVRSTIQKAISSNSNLGSNLLSKIVAEFPEINPSWLITGKGEMLLTGENTLTGRPIVDQANKVFDAEKIKILEENNYLLKKTNALQEELLENYKEKFKECEEQKKIFKNNKPNV
jgi:hypothetical protein